MAYCSKCGSKLNDGSAFCGSCGARVGSAPDHAPVPEPKPAQKTYASHYDEGANKMSEHPYEHLEKKPVSKFVANWKTDYVLTAVGMIASTIIQFFFLKVTNVGGIGFGLMSVFYAIGIFYVLKVLNSCYKAKPVVNDNKVISFFNGFFGGVLFGCLFNWSLSKRESECGCALPIYVVLFALVVLSGVMLMLIFRSMTPLYLPGMV